MKTVNSMPRYSVYKDSGVDWLKGIPEGWELVPLRGILNFRNEKNDPIITENILSLSIANGVTLYSDEGRGGNKRKDDLTAYKIARPNDIVMNSMNIIVGAVGLSKYFGAISPVYYALYAQNSSVFVPFYEQIFQHIGFQRSLLRLGKGILIKISDSGKMNTIRMKISQNDMKSLLFPKPSIETQILITNFLNQKTTQIDQAIAIKQKQIERLKERQQIIIQQAVTKGLDANVPMKDSGIEWIGMIPEHWEIKKLKYVLQLTNKKQLSLNSELLYIGMENIESGTGEFIETNSETEGLANYFEANQLLFGKLRPYLAKVYKTRTIGLCSTEFLVYKCPDNLCIDFYHCFLISPEFIKVINASTYGSKMPRANSDFIGNQMILVPPLKEQIEINQYVIKNKNNIKQLIIIYQQQIEKLKEYKTTLIDSAVTGKIKITPEE